ncbi:MAG TPA: DNA polymerase III subunit delta', partial [Methylibium sp.]|nr:DNA polymerase III subunit delta' [Methylibium sp.]
LARLAAAGRALLAAARHAEHPWNAPLGVEALVQRVRRALLPTAGPSQPPGSGEALATLVS